MCWLCSGRWGCGMSGGGGGGGRTDKILVLVADD